MTFKANRELTPAGFFVIRTPLLPFDEINRWSAGLEVPADAGDEWLERTRAILRERLREIVSRADVQEALFLASPDLVDALPTWETRPDSDAGRRLELALVRYFLRMAGRATPFGLFAATTIGKTDRSTKFELGPRAGYRRYSALDMEYLTVLSRELGRDPEVRHTLTLSVNTSLTQSNGRIQYYGAARDGGDRRYELYVVESSEYLAAVLERAASGCSFDDVVAMLVEHHEAGRDEAAEYVDGLIDADILIGDLDPLVTGPDPFTAMVSELRTRRATERAGETLNEVRARLDSLDSAGLGNDVSVYREMAAHVEMLPAPVALSRLFMVDLYKPAETVTLGRGVLSEIMNGIEVLRLLDDHRARHRDAVRRFGERFLDRFGDNEVPLAVALDEDLGVGFEPYAAPNAPLIHGLHFPSAASERTMARRSRTEFLLRAIGRALEEGRTEVALDQAEIRALETDRFPQVPDSFMAFASIAAESEEAIARGEYRVLLEHCDGPSGARLLGRFCHGDAGLRAHVEEYLRAEEALEPNAIFAEIVHLPPIAERLGNVICRPLLRSYEIPYLGRSGAPSERQIEISDILVSVVDGRVTLRSQRLNKQIIPRLTNAHAYMFETHLPAYRFLAALQEQGYCAMNGGWLEELNDRAPLPFLPRIRAGRVVLSRARWIISEEELEVMTTAKGAAQFQAVQEMRRRRRLPRWIQLDEMVVDLDNPLCVETLVVRLSGRTSAKVRELFPAPDELLARGPEGRFVHELVVPFLRNREATRGERLPPRASVPKDIRLYAPGSEWLFAKVYAGPSFADALLTDVIGPLACAQIAAGAADRWFFVRFRDGREHLRIRFHGAPERLSSEVLPALRDAVMPHMYRGSITGFQLDSYDREVERYGGPDGIDIVEHLFMADSEAVIELLRLCADDEVTRWRAAVLGAEMLMRDFALDRDQRRKVLEHLQQHFDGKMMVDAATRRAIADRYRSEAKTLEVLLTTLEEPDHPLGDVVTVLLRRSREIAPYVENLSRLRDAARIIFPLDALAASCVHMFMYRLLLVEQNAQETVLYHFLSRFYDSMAARTKNK